MEDIPLPTPQTKPFYIRLPDGTVVKTYTYSLGQAVEAVFLSPDALEINTDSVPDEDIITIENLPQATLDYIQGMARKEREEYLAEEAEDDE